MKKLALLCSAVFALAGCGSQHAYDSIAYQQAAWNDTLKKACSAVNTDDIQQAEEILLVELAKTDGPPRQKNLQSQCQYSLGKTRFFEGHFDAAVAMLEKLSDDNHVLLNERYLPLSTNVINLADCYYLDKKYDKALPLYQQAKELLAKDNADRDLIPCLRKLARCYDGLKQFDKAQAYYDEDMKLVKKLEASKDEQTSVGFIFEHANLLWDYSTFLRMRNKKVLSEQYEKQAESLVNYLTKHVPPPKTTEKYVLGFKTDSSAVRLASYIDVFIASKKFIDAERMLGRLYELHMEFAGFGTKENNYLAHKQFVQAFYKIWCSKNGKQ